jgi:hypothetical protein
MGQIHLFHLRQQEWDVVHPLGRNREILGHAESVPQFGQLV